MVAIAVAIVFGYVEAPAFVDVSRTVADSTLVVVTHAVVYVVADAISIIVGFAGTSAFT